MKPFRLPSIVRPQNQQDRTAEPPTKKPRLSQPSGTGFLAKALHAAKSSTPVATSRSDRSADGPTRTPLDNIKNLNPSQTSQQSQSSSLVASYNVLWRRFTTKKNKTWDGDGTLTLEDGFATLRDDSGKAIGRTPYSAALDVGSTLSLAGREVEVESVNQPQARKQRLETGENGSPKPAVALLQNASSSDYQARAQHALVRQRPKFAAFKTPVLNNTVQTQDRSARIPVPRHDPNAPNALVMKRPRQAPPGKQIVDVVVDPTLTAKLHPHQRDGVAFLYECVMGMKTYGGEGAILADEMGLGKTLQTIALLWTLLKQNPIYDQPPVVRKALIVCPVTLVKNWRKEFRKWLGNENIGVFVVDDKHTRLTDFTKGKAYSVMIIGYEKLRMVQEDLQKGAGIDIVIADEGHRLKTAQNKSAQAIKSLNTERRVILSGTPLQNDLAEFYTMVDFVNPGLLNKYSSFKRDFEVPILKSQQPGASDSDLEKGVARGQELSGITNTFILRRTAEILLDYLPPKTEYVVFCRLTKAQATVYRGVLQSPAYSATAQGSSSLSLELINVLKKVCNDPSLLLKQEDKGDQALTAEKFADISPKLLKHPGASGKFMVLNSLLHTIRTTTEEKVVIVSNYTTTLDMLAILLNGEHYKYVRLDGKTPPKKRQDLVDTFNRASAAHSFVFLLSAKAGGVGLNLIGASRLILYDLDWNPATDLQAMARVHRHGQTRPCIIYRLITQGALDEKIFQRQVSKTGLADSIVDGKGGVTSFTQEELRDIFTMNESESCQTHNLLACSCGGKGVILPNGKAYEPDDDEPISDDDIDEINTKSENRGFIKSSQQLLSDQTEDNVRSDRRDKMMSLMKYAHFDTTHVMEAQSEESSLDIDDASGPSDLDVAIEDQVLHKVLRDDPSRIGFVLVKATAIEKKDSS